jgi:S-formylglutathione hydrolase FrmB
MLFRTVCLLGCLVALHPAPAAAGEKQPLRFELTFDKAAVPTPFTGRVYVLLSRGNAQELPAGPNWFAPEPFFAVDVKDWQPGQPLTVDDKALAHPTPLAKLAGGKYTIQAVMDLNRGARSFARSPGNVYSKPARQDIDPAASGTVKLVLDQVFQEPPFKDTERVKLVEVESKMLSKFYGRPTHLRAAVILPKSFKDNADKQYPVIYEIPGFTGRHTAAPGIAKRNPTEVAGVEMLYVVLDPDCPLGHHVFADSDNNGPCGRALVEELIPQLEKQYRAIGTPQTRFLTGHSSGGWSSLWLQVTYPDFFGGTWSTAPDAVDFRDFQRVNIYQPGVNLFTDGDGNKRPLGRFGKQVLMWYQPFSDMETVMGRGGQLFSFEAVFGPRGADGRPVPLWDRKTGAIDAQVAEAWKRYDIRMVLEKNWPTLGPKLAGKLHVFMGDQDNFYLEGATVLLKQALAKLGSDAVVEIFPGKDHTTVMTQTNLRQRIATEMAEQFLKGQKQK